MRSLFRRAPATRAARPPRVFLRLEDLEGRATPSGDLVPVYSGTVLAPPNQAPQIVDFAAEEMGTGLFMFTGRVLDESPGNLTITFGGSVVTMVGRTCTTDANGYFSIVVQLQTNGTDIGWVTARTQDALGVPSNEPAVEVRPMA